MKNILVTGGAGFIGSNFVRYLYEKEPKARIINLDLLTYAGHLESLKTIEDSNRHVFVHGDICDSELVSSLFDRYEIDTVVHFAAESHVDRSIHGPAEFMQVNILGTFTLLEAARQAWLIDKKRSPSEVKFHHVSTDEVYGSLEPAEEAFTELTPYDPRSPYSASKASSDHLVRAYFHTYQLPITITNCSNNYGPFQFPEKLIPLMILNAMRGKPLPIYGDGKQVRDWLFVMDHCKAIYRVLVDGELGETYNIGGDSELSNIEIVQKICALLDECLVNSEHRPHANLVTYVTDRPGHDRRYAMNISKVRRDLGWEPEETLESGLRKTVDWYLNNLDWVSTILNRDDFKEWEKQNYDGRTALK